MRPTIKNKILNTIKIFIYKATNLKLLLIFTAQWCKCTGSVSEGDKNLQDTCTNTPRASCMTHHCNLS